MNDVIEIIPIRLHKKVWSLHVEKNKNTDLELNPAEKTFSRSMLIPLQNREKQKKKKRGEKGKRSDNPRILFWTRHK